jgi:hypothetical protein
MNADEGGTELDGSRQSTANDPIADAVQHGFIGVYRRQNPFLGAIRSISSIDSAVLPVALPSRLRGNPSILPVGRPARTR